MLDKIMIDGFTPITTEKKGKEIDVNVYNNNTYLITLLFITFINRNISLGPSSLSSSGSS